MFKLLREIKKLLKEIRDELRKSNKPVRFIDESNITELNENRGGYLGAKVEPRKSFADKIKHTKKDIRKVAKKGIPYKNKNYTFDGWENHIGEIINFKVFDDYLILNLEGQVLHATTQDI